MKLTAEHVPCHCGGAISRLTWVQHIWFNIMFILMAQIAIYLTVKKKKSNNNNFKRTALDQLS